MHLTFYDFFKSHGTHDKINGIWVNSAALYIFQKPMTFDVLPIFVRNMIYFRSKPTMTENTETNLLQLKT